MKKILLVLAFWSGLICAQNTSTKQGIELPEFVITGKESYELPAAEKIPAPFISTVSDEFLKPAYSPEFLETSSLTSPLKKEMQQRDTAITYFNKLGIQAGVVPLPSIAYSTVIPIDEFTLGGYLNAGYNRPHVDNSGKLVFNPGAEVKYKILSSDNFLSDNELSIKGDYNYSNYKLYAKPDPETRDIHATDLSLGLASSKRNFWQYNFMVRHQYHQLSKENMNESKFTFFGSAGISGRAVEFSPQIQYSQYMTNDSANWNVGETYVKVDAPLRMIASDIFSVDMGLNYTSLDTAKGLNPLLGVEVKLKNGLMVFASYHPGYQIYDYEKVLGLNAYSYLKNFRATAYPQNAKLDISLMYELNRQFDIIASLEYYKSNDFPYFQYRGSDASFELRKTKAYSTSASLELRMQPGEFGYFYGKLKFNTVEDTSGYKIPFNPGVELYAAYGYTLPEGVTAKAGIKLRGSQYADILNNEWMGVYHTFFLELGYALSREFLFTFKIDNLLNRKNYIWKNYQETPFNMVAGVTFQW
jgi:hypothetical protein